MNKLISFAAIISVSAFAAAGPAFADCTSTSSAAAYDDGKQFVADSFSFGAETQNQEQNDTVAASAGRNATRKKKESGEKGGTEDINIGVGELQECTISKSMD